MVGSFFGWLVHPIGICSGHPMKELSPMRMGPVMVDGKVYAKNIEDGWQGAKVWSEQMTNGHFDKSKPAFWVISFLGFV